MPILDAVICGASPEGSAVIAVNIAVESFNWVHTLAVIACDGSKLLVPEENGIDIGITFPRS
jgi:hypothetical protein